MIELKPGVRLTALSPQIGVVLLIANGAWEDTLDEWGDGFTAPPLVVTSCNDGAHSRTSLHYRGSAVDLRTKSLPTNTGKRWFVSELRRRLGSTDFDVILEHLGGVQEHCHLEYQPKGGA